MQEHLAVLTRHPFAAAVLAPALLAMTGAPAAGQQFEHGAALPATSACAIFRSEILPGVESEENMSGLNRLFGAVRREGPRGRQCNWLRENRTKLENDRLLHNTSPYVRYAKERVFAWGNLCALDICDRGQAANYSDDAPRPSTLQEAERPPVSPDNPFAGNRPSPDNPFASNRPSPDNPFASNRPSPDNPFAGGRLAAADNPFRVGAATPQAAAPTAKQPSKPPARPEGTAAGAAPAAKPVRPDRDPGQVRDAKSCIVVTHEKSTSYSFRNQCPFAVHFVYSGRDFQKPVEYTADRVGKAPDVISTISYHRHQPEVVWACADGTPGCDSDAALAAQRRRLNGR